eukprot:2374594-Karenia_brevis.AAC.1
MRRDREQFPNPRNQERSLRLYKDSSEADHRSHHASRFGRVAVSARTEVKQALKKHGVTHLPHFA